VLTILFSDERKVIARRAALELKPNQCVNLGIGREREREGEGEGEGEGEWLISFSLCVGMPEGVASVSAEVK
jgi:hypothetical protein